MRLSKKFGANPSVLKCEVCGKEYGVGLFGASIKDKETGKTVEAPPTMVHGLCNDCQKVVDAKGLLVIEVRDGETGNNPYRTGRIVGITADARKRMFPDMDSSICYMERSVFTKIFERVVK